MQHDRTRAVVEIGLSVALAAVLSMFKITLPWNFAGGTVSLAMLPLFVIALRRGLLAGVVAGTAFGVIDYLIEPYFVHPIQVFLDYPIAFAACGCAALIRPAGIAAISSARIGALAFAGSLIGGTGRFAASYVSGVVYFGANAPEGQPVWLYSLLYNASYLVPSILACAVVAVVVMPALERAVPSPSVST